MTARQPAIDSQTDCFQGAQMRVHLTEPMRTALRETAEIPDNLLACVNGAVRDGDALVMTLSEDEAMAMSELCQWYIRRDPSTGTLGEHAKLFEAIVNAIYDAGGG
jgi:hypothetical protein